MNGKTAKLIRKGTKERKHYSNLPFKQACKKVKKHYLSYNWTYREAFKDFLLK